MNKNPKITSNMDYTRTDFRVKQREFATERVKILDNAKIEKLMLQQATKKDIDTLILNESKRIAEINLETQQKLKEVDEREAALMCEYRNMLAIEVLQKEIPDASTND